jgi:putative transposase
MFVRPSQEEAKSGQPFCTITPHRSGRATRFPVTDLFFRPLFAFFIIELKSRKVIHVGVTGSPTDPWVAQQLREATPYGQTPKYLIRDNDSKFGPCFARVATTSTIEILKTPYHAPRVNAICERFAQECAARMPRPPVDFSREATPARAQSVCGVFQPGPTSSRDSATGS